MKDFLVLLISFTLMGCADSIANMFFNLISVDAIVVMGTLTAVGSFMLKIGYLGIYVYRVKREDEGVYALVNLLAAGSVCLVLYVARVPIFSVFGLSEQQFALLYEVLPFFCAAFTVKMCGRFFFEALRLRNLIKLYNISLVAYYAIYLTGGFVCYMTFCSLQSLLLMELAANMFLIVYGAVILRAKVRLCRGTWDDIVKIGFPCTVEQMVFSGNVLIYGVLASHMSETFYAIHSICYSARAVGLNAAGSWHTVLMIKGKEGDAGKQMSFYDRNLGRMSWVLMVFGIGITVLAGYIQHGSLELSQLFPYILFYGLTVYGNAVLETYRAACLINDRVGILLKGTMMFAWLIPLLPLASLVLLPSIDIYVFGLSVGIAAMCRALYYRRALGEQKLDGEVSLP